MTPTDRKVTRVTTGAYPSRTAISGPGYGKLRKLVVTILPGDTIMLRWHGTQQREYIQIHDVMRYATRVRALVERTTKRNARRKA